MCKKVNFNVIEKTKHENVEDIVKAIHRIVNTLIVKEFTNFMENNNE